MDIQIEPLADAKIYNNAQPTEFCWWYNKYKQAEEIVDYSNCKTVDEKVKHFHATVESIVTFEMFQDKYWTSDVVEAFPTQGNIAVLIEQKMFYFARPVQNIVNES